MTRFNASIRITCANCGCDMVFLGLPRGINLDEPVAGPFGIEARLPIRPIDKSTDLKSEVFKVVLPAPVDLPNWTKNLPWTEKWKRCGCDDPSCITIRRECRHGRIIVEPRTYVAEIRLVNARGMKIHERPWSDVEEFCDRKANADLGGWAN